MPPTIVPSRDIVSPMQYDPKVQRRSIDDPIRQSRRSSIPFADRQPAVRFIRAIDLRKRSLAGPHFPVLDERSSKPILKKSPHPILIDQNELGGGSLLSELTVSNTNEELETCRYRAEILMDKFSRAERIGRGSIDILTFPTSTRRVEPLSRYHGCMTVCVCSVGVYSGSEEFKKTKKNADNSFKEDIRTVIDIAKEMQSGANELYATAKAYHSLSKKRYSQWDRLLKKNSEFRIDHCKLNYPIYSTKKMPESVTLYEDAIEEPSKKYSGLDGFVRLCRTYPEGLIALHCDLVDPTEKAVDSVNFQESSLSTQMDIIKCVQGHGRNMIYASTSNLRQGIELLKEKELDEGFYAIKTKIESLEYDEHFDPLCALDFKNTLGELVARKAELLNISEQIIDHCRWMLAFTNKFYKFTKSRLKGSNCCSLLCCCDVSQRSLLQRLGIISVEDITVFMPLTLEIAQDVFSLDVYRDVREDSGGGDT